MNGLAGGEIIPEDSIVEICIHQHQVFGYFSGKAILDNGTVVEFKDFLGFAEKVHNKWQYFTPVLLMFIDLRYADSSRE